jgi:hypothetical protein
MCCASLHGVVHARLITFQNRRQISLPARHLIDHVRLQSPHTLYHFDFAAGPLVPCGSALDWSLLQMSVINLFLAHLMIQVRLNVGFTYVGIH